MTFCISAIASNQGKTIVTTALLSYFRKRVRAYKIGPDFIDPQFHKVVSEDDSINLDAFMLGDKQLKWMFANYKKEVNILEGVMGFYDGMDRGASAYDVTKALQIPTVLVLDGSGSYITISAVLKGLKTYKSDNTIKAVILNKLSSPSHYELIKRQIEKDFDDILVLGWVKKGLDSLKDTHLGLELDDMDKIDSISKEVLEHIELEKFEFLESKPIMIEEYPFEKMQKSDKTLAIVRDKNFSFLYHDNYQFLCEVFRDVIMIDSTKDESIPQVDAVYIPGGYVESDKAYERIKCSENFKNSLKKHIARGGKVYAECAGLLYLGKSVDEKKMSGILPLEFSLQKRFVRLGYYQNKSGVKGHCFHYTKPKSLDGWCDILTKNNKGEFGSYHDKNIFGTYLHTILRANADIVRKRFLS